ncbi:hypothetical protein CDAR_365171 [Caerostris darwini]|uniref:Uncharacterized protein n=1 Tax=Caerostris darwini TaxID=1538125 RepID=A0AAV4U1G1_9ARAC|nr:hypothetical protein CDAR_365171 [Caerostris darwini]
MPRASPTEAADPFLNPFHTTLCYCVRRYSSLARGWSLDDAVPQVNTEIKQTENSEKAFVLRQLPFSLANHNFSTP